MLMMDEKYSLSFMTNFSLQRFFRTEPVVVFFFTFIHSMFINLIPNIGRSHIRDIYAYKHFMSSSKPDFQSSLGCFFN